MTYLQWANITPCISDIMHLSAYCVLEQKLCAQEWFHFVDKEKQVRIRIDGKVNQMIAEAAELKQWTITEV